MNLNIYTDKAREAVLEAQRLPAIWTAADRARAFLLRSYSSRMASCPKSWQA